MKIKEILADNWFYKRIIGILILITLIAIYFKI